MEKTIYLFLADGFEEVEALTAVDVLRRASLPVTTVSMGQDESVEGAHGVSIAADAVYNQVDFSDAAMLVLPGGMPGALNLNNHEALSELLLKCADAQIPLAAICAAPMVLGGLGLLHGKRATCYPGFEGYLDGATYTAQMVEVDGNFITGKGPGAAFDFAFAIVERLCGAETVAELKAGMMLA